MALSFETDIKPMLQSALGGCMLGTPVDPETREEHPCAAFNIFDHVTVIEKSRIMLVELVLEKMPPKQSAPDGFDYQATAKLFAQWIDDGMQP